MRIISGSLGGRNIASPKGHRTHPMSDRARGGVFNMLGDIQGLSVLDAFAGSGALSLEALSRGASKVVAIDIDKDAVAVIERNVKDLRVSNLKVIQANASSWSDTNPDQQFDLVFCDPPYDKLQQPLLEKLVSHLAPDGIYVLSWPGSNAVPDIEGLEHVTTKTYGDAQIVAYRKV
jgi:16S rRNA (guanine966-N2)-methyltransferase